MVKTNGENACSLFGDYDADYPREVIIKRGLEKNGMKVLECNCCMEHSSNKSISSPLYLFKAYVKLLRKFRIIRCQFSVFLIPHNNHLIIPLAWLLSRIYGKRLIVDAFDPAHRTALMNGLSPFQVRNRYYLEKLALKLSDHILVETNEFANLYIEAYRVKKSKFFVLPVGADQTKFYFQSLEQKTFDRFVVLYWGNFHRHHGVEVIIKAAELLRDHDDIRFILVGSGSNRDQYMKMAKDINLKNVEFTGFLSNGELVDLISHADACLGIFSSHRLALCSITNKVLQGLAMGKAVITERSPVAEKLFQHQKHLYMISPENPNELAQALLKIKTDHILRARLEQNGYTKFIAEFSEEAIGKRLWSLIIGKTTVRCG